LALVLAIFLVLSGSACFVRLLEALSVAIRLLFFPDLDIHLSSTCASSLAPSDRLIFLFRSVDETLLVFFVEFGSLCFPALFIEFFSAWGAPALLLFRDLDTDALAARLSLLRFSVNRMLADLFGVFLLTLALDPLVDASIGIIKYWIGSAQSC